ncbi:MAG: class I poly(R)-hydroxyalkanoic acid synthase [Proteobacteria bacterium]|nr:class I poly(R)-hydroxyalkanoic acid synthase [Pseudomonadota bacterium]MDA1023688.1 class I poly(R)-hydroxyalkanoic acid synthase [Pseudomonadota bacterium]
MNDQPRPDESFPGSEEFTRSMMEIAESSQKLLADFLSRQSTQMNSGAEDQGPTDKDPLNIGGAFMEMTSRMMADPAKMVQANMALWQDYVSLWQNSAARMMGGEAANSVEPDKGDRRFKDDAWNENDVFDYIKQSYLLTSRWLQSTVGDVEGLSDKDAQKVDFYTRQFTEAMSPSNFALTNPEVLRATVESKGENLLNGLKNLLHDLDEGKGQLKIRMTDEDAFEVGKNVATSKGKVVYRNDLMELIQFDPSTKTVNKTPLLIMPPWINKYYILDLRPENSFIKWSVDQGHTVFVISWVNPDEKLAHKTFDDYMLEGPLAAIAAIEKATGEDKINVVGYCLGGTLLACTLAYMAAKKDDRIKTATFFTAMVDFSDPGELGVFIDEEQLDSLEKKMDKKGYLEGAHMATTFNMMRGNDLIWSFVVNNYLLGKDPFPFDLLYWNSDATRMTPAMHSFYLRKMYLENKLVEPGGITLDGVALDLSKITVPTYIISTREDHIAPWQSTYAAVNQYSGPVKFVLSASGHIAGIVNPPAAKKYCYWSSDGKKKNPKKPDAWFNAATQHEGSWWPDWDKWTHQNAAKNEKKIKARKPGSGELKALCNAPGEYVRVRSDEE